MLPKHLIGFILALLAALLNATVGIISVNLFQSGLSPESIAFIKCFIALMFVGSLLIITGQYRLLIPYFKEKGLALASSAFFGLFILYHFETAAYETINVPVVVFCLFGASTITTFILEAIIEKRFLHLNEILSMMMAIFGLSLIFIEGGLLDENMIGMVNAMLSGMGYGTFLVLSKRFNIGTGLVTLFGLLFFGVIYLSFPFLSAGSIHITLESLFYLVLLALLPTICGFWATTKALTLIKSQSVQLIELTEPLFAICFSFIFLAQLSTTFEILGGGCIILSIILHEYLPLKSIDKPAPMTAE
ncbi:DMT family transporter [Shewanella surugensis]|uniref:DMT family transporter n=1 Tax=Shewanella surugensis TaxID=212020 RepID=A0ABT0LAB2_9GAMM|nr:DMT family transporter [Shewanella surugensis]MCL1124300.1 DMT family transporter [Shewanella surugensis]